MSPASVFVESSQMWFLSYHKHPLLVPARLDTATDLHPRELCYKANQSHEIQRYWWQIHRHKHCLGQPHRQCQHLRNRMQFSRLQAKQKDLSLESRLL